MRSIPWFRFWLLGFIVISACQQDPNMLISVDNSDEEIDFSRVLILGNSILQHNPAPNLGWSGDWGMAASSRESDYLHRLLVRLEDQPSYQVTQHLRMSTFERIYWRFDFSELDALSDYQPSLIIINLGENVDEEKAEQYDFGQSLIRLAEYFDPKKEATVVLVNSFWKKPITNQQIENTSEDAGYIFTRIDDLETLENQAFGDFENLGVGAHPNDGGMQAISDRIAEALGI